MTNKEAEKFKVKFLRDAKYKLYELMSRVDKINDFKKRIEVRRFVNALLNNAKNNTHNDVTIIMRLLPKFDEYLKSMNL